MSKQAKIFIDGAAGTTGLEIRERLAGRTDVSLIVLPEGQRKGQAARKIALNQADLVILCLPDEAAREAVRLIENPATRVVDASTAHRVTEGWDYGFAELEPDGYARITASRRVSNPGCWATGFLAIARPLVRAGLVAADFPLTANGVSGYSGGGKSMIAEFEESSGADYTETVSRLYGLGLTHKHIPEMQKHSGLAHPPLFEPSVGRYYRGMLVEVPLQLWALPATPGPRDIHAALVKAYPDRPLVKVASLEDAAAVKSLDAEIFAGTNGLTLYVFANEKARQARVVAAFDNLGKGASGAAVQNMNIMLGLPETTGL
jgi:N-acetyl-gamma-glutamyl-phosphate reductase